MVTSFGDKATEPLYHGKGARVPRTLQGMVMKAAIRKLDMLNGAHHLKDLRSSPGNRLEALTGSREGFLSMQIDARWRIIFKWDTGQAKEVQLTVYL